MARVEVRHLRYRGEPARAGRVEFAVTDALRTEVVDDGRLVLVRSFRLGRIGLVDRGASQAAASAWRTIRQGACHGGSSGAEGANCVWFADAAEARTLLMRELARGRTPFAWFWLLAVPEWRREALPQWLGRRLDEALHDPSGETAATLVAEALAGDCVEPLATAILARVPLPAVAGRRAAAGDEERSAASKEAGEPADRPVQPVEDAADQAVALAVVRAIPEALRTVLAKVAGHSELADFVETIARGLVRRAHPALSLMPGRLAAIAAMATRILRFGEPPARYAPAPRGATSRAAPADAPARPGDRAPPATGLATPARATQAVAGNAVPAAPPPVADGPAPADLLPTELRSAAAGLFLAIVPLVRLGWREWLIERPQLLPHQPGQRLLRRIAAHYHVPASDPLWSHLPPVDLVHDAPDELEQALCLWRTGLDRWLRRRARLPLAELVLRRGWLLPGVETTLVRFPLEAIEIRLRRLALDGDPGWVDWLGHSYRMVYRDRPLLGGDPG